VLDVRFSLMASTSYWPSLRALPGSGAAPDRYCP